MTKIDYESLGKAVGKLVAEKQQAYGDSFSKSHKILKVLYPDGIQTGQYMDVLTICRVVDKLLGMRVLGVTSVAIVYLAWVRTPEKRRGMLLLLKGLMRKTPITRP